LTPLDGPTRALLQQMRWRKPPRDRRQLALALTVALLLHALFVLLIWHEIGVSAVPSVANVPVDNVMQVRFITHAKSSAAPPPPDMQLPPPLPRPRAVVRREPLDKDAMTVQLPAAKPSSTPLRLFDKNGQPLLPAASASIAPEADYVQRMPQDEAKVMQHSSPVKYIATRFDRNWDKSDNSVDQGLQKAVDATTMKHTFNLPRGVHIHCVLSPAMLAGGCGGDPPPPPSKKDGDERLSMAPTQPLATDPHPPQPPSVDACIAMYRADKPLAFGCPVDTPNRAIDAELRERAKGAASHP
jgi:hypothetical protein